MSRKLTTILLAAVILTVSMGLKTILGVQSTDVVLMANGTAPMPPPVPAYGASQPLQNGTAPMPPPVPAAHQSW